MNERKKATPPKVSRPKEPERAADEDIDKQLDKELADSFPASDPPSLTQDQR